MPTGYTDGVRTGKITGFRDFVLRCARAMGAYIDMRDESGDAPLRVFKPSTYHQSRMEEGREMLADLQSLTPDQVRERAEQDYQLAHISWQEGEEFREQVRERYTAMLTQVVNWRPPTPDHQGLKQFMYQQLADSLSHDCYHTDPPEKQEPQAWLEEQIDEIQRSMSYHAEHHAAEVKRTRERNLWVRQMCESLGVPAPQEIA